METQILSSIFSSRSCGFCYGFSSSFPTLKLRRKSVLVSSKKKKDDNHPFTAQPHESTGFFPESLLLKQKKVAEDGKLLPDFADAEEEKLYEYLNLKLESQLNVEQVRHYEVVYLIHEKNAEEVDAVNQKVQDFLGPKKGKIWRVSDWGMRRLAYKIKKAKHAHYILMNFELEAKWINEFKTMLDTDERVIRHLVIKRDDAITEDCPPPPDFHTLRSGMDDDSEEDDMDDYNDEDDMDWDGEDELDDYGDDGEDEIIVINSEYDEEVKASKAAATSNGDLKNRRHVKVNG